MNILNKAGALKVALTSAALTVASAPAFAEGESVADQITATITSNMATATGIVTAAGLALIGLAFLTFVMRKGQRAGNGRP